mmetsp:Transcript_46980/g.110647  ORF Transcript_46980/g.110647 Transcript_46980/m.110647 type:complete len:201 (+) Transcript_46980:376-978(+)
MLTKKGGLTTKACLTLIGNASWYRRDLRFSTARSKLAQPAPFWSTIEHIPLRTWERVGDMDWRLRAMFFKYSRQSSSVFSFFGSNQLGRIPMQCWCSLFLPTQNMMLGKVALAQLEAASLETWLNLYSSSIFCQFAIRFSAFLTSPLAWIANMHNQYLLGAVSPASLAAISRAWTHSRSSGSSSFESVIFYPSSASLRLG